MSKGSLATALFRAKRNARHGCPGRDRTNGAFVAGLRRGNFFGERRNRRRTTARTGTVEGRRNYIRLAKIVRRVSRRGASNVTERQRTTGIQPYG